MENQVTQLKLNVTNIKSYLINSNKQLGKLRKDKKNLFSKIEKKRELRAEENRLETVNKIGSGFSRIANAIKAPAVNIFDKVLEFFGLIATGILVQKIPQIVEKINQFFNSDFFKSIKSMFSTLAKGVGFLVDIVGGFSTDDQNKLMDEKEKLKKEEKRLTKESKKLESVKNDWSKILSDLSIPMAPMAPGSMYPMPAKTKKPQKKAKGGTITADQSTSTPRKSGPLKRAERGMGDGFTGFSLAVNNIEEAVQRDKENVKAFAEASDKFVEWSTIKDPKVGEPAGTGAGTSGPMSTMNMIPGNGKVRGGAKITDYNDPDAEQTGMDIALLAPNGDYDIGAIIQNPFSELKITKTGYQFANGRGYGWYVTGNAVIQGKTYELLVGHLDKVSVQEGQIIKAGDSIGTQGMSGSTSGPHVTTHINDLSGGGNAQAVLNSVANSWKNGNIIQTDGIKKQNNGRVTTIPKVAKALNTSNNSDGNQSLFVYAVQPVETFVPFPYPVPVKQLSSSAAPQKPRVPAVWRS
jgi:hypothetical protein